MRRDAINVKRFYENLVINTGGFTGTTNRNLQAKYERALWWQHGILEGIGEFLPNRFDNVGREKDNCIDVSGVYWYGE